MSDKKIEKPEADQLLEHGGNDAYTDAARWYDIRTHNDSDMDASWRLKGTKRSQELADGTASENLARVALRERQAFFTGIGSLARRIEGIVGELTEEEMWQVLKYGDVIDTEGKDPATVKQVLAEKNDLERKEYERLKAKYKAENEREAELARLQELKKKFE